MNCVHLTALQVIFLLIGTVDPCGPGRGSGHRRGPRKMTPLVFKQHVPNLSEHTLGASGLAEGPITRNDPKMKDLVINYNPDILFKDEEGTGADRLMSQRCRDKLNTLAIAVINQWPDVKLRVTEGWDEDGHHAAESLHYEGRAVDITTSDRDRSKYGMLARLAVEAGFDWVYFESRGHIHCSVKSDSSIAIKTGGCFTADSSVYLETGQILPMSAVRINDRILTIDRLTGALIYDDVIAFLHRDDAQFTEFVEIWTEDGSHIALTADHLIFTAAVSGDNLEHSRESVTVSDSGAALATTDEPVFARNVHVGTYVYVVTQASSSWMATGGGLNITSATLRRARVISVNLTSRYGVYAPLTSSGTLVVDGLAASCYASFASQRLAHASMTPLVVTKYVRDTIWYGDSANLDGTKAVPLVHWYAKALQTVGRYILPNYLWYET